MNLHIYRPTEEELLISAPFFMEPVKAGFPSPAAGYEEAELNLHQYCVNHPSATFFVRASGSSMLEGGISNNDLLVVDRSLTPEDGDIIIASIDNEFTVKMLKIKGDRPCLMPMNPQYSPIYFDPDTFQVWGVVTFIIKRTNNVRAC